MKKLILIVVFLLCLVIIGCQSLDKKQTPTRVPESDILSHFGNACNNAANTFFVYPENEKYIRDAAGLCGKGLVQFYENNVSKSLWPGPYLITKGTSAARTIAIQIAQEWRDVGYTDNPGDAEKALTKAFGDERIVLEKELIITPSP